MGQKYFTINHFHTKTSNDKFFLNYRMSSCYYLLYSLQYNVSGLCYATCYGRLEDVKKHFQNGVDVNEKNEVSNYIYTYATLVQYGQWKHYGKYGQ